MEEDRDADIKLIRKRIACESANFAFNISHIKIRALPSDIFTGCRNICNLEITNTLLKTLPEKIFANMPLLQRVNLHANQLQVLPDKLFANCRMISHVVLSWNLLETLPMNLFKNCPLLKTLNVSNNYLRKIPSALFAEDTKLKTLNLTENICLKTLPECILLQVHHISSIQCNTIDSLVGMLDINHTIIPLVIPYINNLNYHWKIYLTLNESRLCEIIHRHRRIRQDAFSTAWYARKYPILAKSI